MQRELFVAERVYPFAQLLQTVVELHTSQFYTEHVMVQVDWAPVRTYPGLQVMQVVGEPQTMQ